MNEYRVMGFIRILVIWTMVMSVEALLYVVSGSGLTLIIAVITSFALGGVAYLQDRDIKRIWEDD